MRIGIFFGGPAREREISFAGGKTAFEYMDRSLFEPIPVFVDSFGRFIKLNPKWMYEAGIRDFYPALNHQIEGFKAYIDSFPELRTSSIPAEIGVLLTPDQFSDNFDFVFLAMHGPDCEDGAIQGLLEWYRLPYSGPGIMGSAVGIDKVLQNDMIALVNGQKKECRKIQYEQWISGVHSVIFEEIKDALGLPVVVKAPHQGSSIGVAIVKHDNLADFVTAINQCFFQIEISSETWSAKNIYEKKAWAQSMANMDEGIGFPVCLNGETIYHPAQLITYLDKHFNSYQGSVIISNSNTEDHVLLEEFIEGQEFSCGCIQLQDGTPVALPPTEVIKVDEVFDFNSKYRPGGTRKRIPVNTSLENNLLIQNHITSVFEGLGMNVCARIDGFLTADNVVLLHDPNTIPGMSPSSLIFKQMAEIGLNVTQALTYFIRQSIRERIRTGKDTWNLRGQLAELDKRIAEERAAARPTSGLVFEATDEAYAEARKWYGKVNAERRFKAIPVLKVENQYFQLPNQLMFKEFIEDVLAVIGAERDPLIKITAEETISIKDFYVGEASDKVVLLEDYTAAAENWS
jgi:D-alanine-D-alanine ligase